MSPDDDLGCGCTSGKRWELHFDCAGCMARHYVHVLSGTTPYNVEYRKARYKQLEKAWPADKFAEWWKLVQELRNAAGRADDRAA